jgi:hypothetical protein
MKSDLWRWIAVLSLTAWAQMGCQGGGNNIGSGGTFGTGGFFNTGGTYSSGGTPGTGGIVGTGGIPNSDGGLTNTTTWDGYAEAYAFAPDGSDRLRLTLTSNGVGSLEVGDSALLAPPHDSRVGYPPAADPSDSSGLWEGFLYPFHSAQISPDRIQFGIDPNEIFEDWCVLQTSYPVGQYQGTPDGAVETAYGCVARGAQFGFSPSGLPDGGPDAGAGCFLTDADGGAGTPVDCGKLNLCVQDQVCSCTATECVASLVPFDTPPLSYPIALDAALDVTGTSMTGTLVLPGTRVVIHLQRQ